MTKGPKIKLNTKPNICDFESKSEDFGNDNSKTVILWWLIYKFFSCSFGIPISFNPEMKGRVGKELCLECH